jgi:glycine/D-amino acid oxidase-like deaminating enzyme
MLPAEPKAYGSNRHAATRAESPDRSRLTVESDVDVCVIGAGLAGLTAALEVARRGWSVVVLEAHSIGWSASGRNAGVVTPGFAASPDALIERVGLDHAKTLWAQSVAGAEYVRNAAREMPGVELSETGWLHVSRTDDTRSIAHEAALVTGEFGVTVEPWPTEQVRAMLHSPRYFHGLHYPAGFSVHPLNYALGLAAAAEALGARIYEDTPVVEIDPAGVRKRIVTPSARVRAAHVVLAGGGHLEQLVPHFASTLVPVYTAGVTTLPLGGQLQDTLRYPGAVGASRVAGHHHRIVDEDRILWTGRSRTWLGSPKRAGDALLRQIRRTYPALGNVKANHAWVGLTGTTVSGMPQIGEVSPGLWLLGGFGGHGIAATAMGGEIVARGIVESDAAWRMFAPFELVWAGGLLGRAAKQTHGWARGSRESLEGFLARRRDSQRRRAEAAKAATVEAAPPMAPDVPWPEPPAAPEPEIEPPVPKAVAAIIHEAAAQAEPPPVTAFIAEEPLPEILEGQSGGAAPPIPETSDEPPSAPATGPLAESQPAKFKRKRGKKRKGQAAPKPGAPSSDGDSA